MKLDIEKILNLSTAHITARDNGHLSECAKLSNPSACHSEVAQEYNAAGWVIETGFGFMIFVPPKGNREEVEDHVKGFKHVGMSPEFIAIFKLAAEKGCRWLRLDCDIPVVEGLPEFDW